MGMTALNAKSLNHLRNSGFFNLVVGAGFGLGGIPQRPSLANEELSPAQPVRKTLVSHFHGNDGVKRKKPESLA